MARMVTPLQQLAAGLSGVAGGLLAGFFGVGGNFLLIPLLGAALGLTQHQAQGLTLAALLPPLNLPAVWQYRRAGVSLNGALTGFAMLGFVSCVGLGGLLANQVPSPWLRVLFSLLLAGTAVRVSRQSAASAEVSGPLPSSFRWRAVVVGAVGGFASGLLGIGGALVIIPLLRRWLSLGQKEAQLTSLVVLLPPVALPGVWAYAQAQEAMPWATLGSIAGGFIVGSFAGARLNRVVSAAKLQRGFGVLLGVSALVMLVSSLRAM